MEIPPSKRLKVYDWPALYKEFNKVGGFLREFCLQRDINYTNASKKFAAFDREAEEEAKKKAISMLMRGAPMAATKIVSLLQSEKEEVALKAAQAQLGMIGISPQASIQAAQVNVQVNVPPFFANADSAEDLKALLQGGKVVDVSPDE